MMSLKHTLYDATMEVLEGLGEDTMRALLWQLGTRGINFAVSEFDIHSFAEQLHDLLGDGSESILEEIYQNFVCRMELLGESEPNNFGFAKSRVMEATALQKIKQLFGEGNVDEVTGVDTT